MAQTFPKGHEFVIGRYDDPAFPYGTVVVVDHQVSSIDFLVHRKGLPNTAGNQYYRDLTDFVGGGEKTLENLQAGDKVKDFLGNVRTVLGVAGRVYFISDSRGEYVDYMRTAIQLKQNDYTVVQDTPDTIEIGGKKYKAEDVKERVAELEPVEEN